MKPMNKHTPGPWATEHKAPFVWVIYGPDNTWIAQTLPRPDDDNADSLDRIEANARLIAAAPDLLAALKACSADRSKDENPMLSWAAAIKAAEAAIAKAEGSIEQKDTAE